MVIHNKLEAEESQLPAEDPGTVCETVMESVCPPVYMYLSVCVSVCASVALTRSPNWSSGKVPDPPCALSGLDAH